MAFATACWRSVEFGGGTTVIDAALEVFAELQQLEAKMRDLEHAMTEAKGRRVGSRDARLQ
ncbi:MAG: hypothetical protein U0Y68_14255 [Blastocatellia bacterium]